MSCWADSTREVGEDGVSSRPSRHGLCWDVTLKKRFRLIKRTRVMCQAALLGAWLMPLPLSHLCCCHTFGGPEALQLLCSGGACMCAWRSHMRILEQQQSFCPYRSHRGLWVVLFGGEGVLEQQQSQMTCNRWVSRLFCVARFCPCKSSLFGRTAVSHC